MKSKSDRHRLFFCTFYVPPTSWRCLTHTVSTRKILLIRTRAGFLQVLHSNIHNVLLYSDRTYITRFAQDPHNISITVFIINLIDEIYTFTNKRGSSNFKFGYDGYIVSCTKNVHLTGRR
jgi:hypothetical protein